jgi:tetratricopeptide (TPR) repeat protein
MTQIIGDIDAAIQLYREALKLDEDHYYAWHDLFACLFEKLKAGENTLAEMRKALDMVEKTGTGKPGLGAQHIAKLEEIYSWSAQRFEAN